MLGTGSRPREEQIGDLLRRLLLRHELIVLSANVPRTAQSCGSSQTDDDEPLYYCLACWDGSWARTRKTQPAERSSLRLYSLVTMPVTEALLRETRHGLVADVDGWFVLNACDSRWRDFGPLGKSCDFEGKRRFKQLGVNLNVLAPGEPLGLYHSEERQEGFLVLAGECLLIVEGEERMLEAWDFFHCPPGTAHVIVGAGAGLAVVVAVGVRGGRKGIRYQVASAGLKHRAAVEQETTKSTEAYARMPKPSRSRYHPGWLPGPTG